MTGYYNSYIATAVTSLDAGARRVAEEFSDLSAMEIQVLDTDGRCLYTSVGYAIGHEKLTTSDFRSAVAGVTATYTGRNAGTDENVMSVASPPRRWDRKLTNSSLRGRPSVWVNSSTTLAAWVESSTPGRVISRPTQAQSNPPP